MGTIVILLVRRVRIHPGQKANVCIQDVRGLRLRAGLSSNARRV
jgi:hypothetical protein